MAIFYINPYDNYYEKLKSEKELVNKAKRVLEDVTKIVDIDTNLLDSMSGENWKEAGQEYLKSEFLPQIIEAIKNLNKNVEQALIPVSERIVNNLVSMLETFKDLDLQYEKNKETLDKLREPSPKYELDSNNEETTTLTSAYKTYQSTKDELTTNVDSDFRTLTILKESIDKEIASIKGVTTTKIEEIKIKEEEVKKIVNSQITSTNLSLDEEARAFVGDIDNDDYYISPKIGKVAQTPTLWYNGKEYKRDDEIVVKKGETIRIIVKLPVSAGKIKQLQRTTADGAKGWQNYATAVSEPYVNRKDPSTFLRTNYYEWVVTGDKVGSTTISQTMFHSTEQFNQVKSMIRLKLKVVDS